MSGVRRSWVFFCGLGGGGYGLGYRVLARLLVYIDTAFCKNWSAVYCFRGWLDLGTGVLRPGAIHPPLVSTLSLGCPTSGAGLSLVEENERAGEPEMGATGLICLPAYLLSPPV
jgi:hypothetical protein